MGRYRCKTLKATPEHIHFSSVPTPHTLHTFHTQVYAPSRTCVVYALADTADKDADKKPHGIPGLGIKDLGPYFSR